MGLCCMMHKQPGKGMAAELATLAESSSHWWSTIQRKHSKDSRLVRARDLTGSGAPLQQTLKCIQISWRSVQLHHACMTSEGQEELSCCW
jgi:hypothetical protein